LNTVAILVKEMASEHKDKPDLQNELEIISEQVQRCKEALKELVSQADFRKAAELEVIGLDNFVGRLLNQWQLLRPETSLSLTLPEQKIIPMIKADATLQQAIVNILNNAADASLEKIAVDLAWDTLQWTMSIRDYGDGINEDMVRHLGLSFGSSKQDGLGIGLVLSQASINRLGGEIRIQQLEGKGSLIEISLPLAEKSRI